MKLKVPPGVFLEEINKRSIKVKQPAAPSTPATGTEAAREDAPAAAEHSVEVFLVEPIWTKPFLAYMLRQELPEDTVEARRITRRAKAFTIIGGELYKRSISAILQRCIASETVGPCSSRSTLARVDIMLATEP